MPRQNDHLLLISPISPAIYSTWCTPFKTRALLLLVLLMPSASHGVDTGVVPSVPMPFHQDALSDGRSYTQLVTHLTPPISDFRQPWKKRMPELLFHFCRSKLLIFLKTTTILIDTNIELVLDACIYFHLHFS